METPATFASIVFEQFSQSVIFMSGNEIDGRRAIFVCGRDYQSNSTLFTF